MSVQWIPPSTNALESIRNASSRDANPSTLSTAEARHAPPAAAKSANMISICRIDEINFAPMISQIDFGTIHSI